MTAAGYGEDQPRLADDRLPMVLVTLDGLGDRGIPELDGLTPCEAAHTPNLDALATKGMNGWHLPFGWGRAPTSELAHWAMFGFGDVPFPGRAVLEALGSGLSVPEGTATMHAALRTSRLASSELWITGRAARGADDDDAIALFDELQPALSGFGARLDSLGGRGEALLTFHDHEFAHVSDTDPFFETFHPWLAPIATGPEGEALAKELTALLLIVREKLIRSPVNARRLHDGLPALDVLTTKWSGGRQRLPTFADLHGIRGAAVTSTRLYRGIAELLGMELTHVAPVVNLEQDMSVRLESAQQLIDSGARFVHVHTKATDEAGHTKDPFAKQNVLEELDSGLAPLLELSERAVIAVTGDHATPSTSGVLHTGEPTPVAVAGPTVRPDDVHSFGERPAARGWFGVLSASDLMPILASYANRPVLLGHRLTARPAIVLPDDPRPMRPTAQ